MRYLYVCYDFANALGVQHRNLSMAIVLIYVRNLIATGIVFNIRASSNHIGRMVAFSEHRRWIISVFDRRSIINRLYWHNQQVGYLCFNPFVWEQRGVIATVADQTAMISHLLPMCWATRGWSWGHVMMWARFGSQGSIALNWHSRYSGTRYSGTWYFVPPAWRILPPSHHLVAVHRLPVYDWPVANTTPTPPRPPAPLSSHLTQHTLYCHDHFDLEESIIG